ncbi:ABC transporter permease [Lactococcus garvieae]|uniref:Transport permease protein n=1 Tax=Lactococcus garvieae TaxID=1363 RepID=A0AA43PE77_9LACT|nr:ABC transporter permease [Lactococcus garvieae]MDH7959793.1 ABC transporter permease [Lactococcus garvieae]BDM75160.1 transport permease protein [Lactococcus garvieae]BDW50430.1 transport permease protein [Lactococcus garvieae]
MNFFNRRNQILLKELIKTDFKLRYQGSIIGYLWSILKPVMLFVIMYMVFVRFLRFGSAVPHFAVALLLALTLWNFFAETTNMGMLSIVSRGDLLRKINFSKQVVIFSVAANAMINLIISLFVVIIFALLNGVQMSWTVIWAVPLIFELLLFATGIAFILSTIFVRFRDLGPIWEVAMQAGLYGTPIIYPITQVSATHPTIAKILMMNPMAQIVQDMRYILTFSNNTNPTVWQMIDNPFIVVIPYIIPVIIFGLGLFIFTKNSKKFAEII